MIKRICLILVLIYTIFLITPVLHAQEEAADNPIVKVPVMVSGDTLFNISEGIGTFTVEKRAAEISGKLQQIIKDDSQNPDSITVINRANCLMVTSGKAPIMAVTESDASAAGKDLTLLAYDYRTIIVNKIKEERELYSQEALIKRISISVLYLVLLIGFFWLLILFFPRLRIFVQKISETQLKDIEVKGKELVKSSTLIQVILATLTGIRFAASLFAIYLFITKTLQLWPYTQRWDLQPIIKSVALLIFYTALFYAVYRGINSLAKMMTNKYAMWKGTKIKSVRLKSVEILSADRAVETLTFLTGLLRFVAMALFFYMYITIIFSLFSFSKTWAERLLNYILTPLTTVWTTAINFMPNLFFIIVLVYVFRYIIRFVRFIFMEIDAGNIEFPSFHKDWAMPTYKIVRFMILVLAAIVIFPYLPGSDSPFFQGISVFVGILFSLGSSSAIANMVSGVVLTYMRPFKIGDRVKIADTMGDVVAKTLLVTRIRTVKNVDITIPNAMVLGSHIINYSSSAHDKGLILHTTVTIGYDVPWKQVHALLLAAASETESVLEEPKPFILQTSLDDFYVSYELNVYTNDSQKMSRIYSDLHSKIQDKFNEGGVEILSPHYGAMRDGNQVTIPQDYLPKNYEAPSFRLFGVNLTGINEKKKD